MVQRVGHRLGHLDGAAGILDFLQVADRAFQAFGFVQQIQHRLAALIAERLHQFGLIREFELAGADRGTDLFQNFHHRQQLPAFVGKFQRFAVFGGQLCFADRVQERLVGCSGVGPLH